MIDVMFTAAHDVEADVELEQEDETSPGDQKIKGVWQFTKYPLLQAKRDAILSAFGKRESASLIKKSRALYLSPSTNLRAVCTISKRYPKNPSVPYWYAYHPQWDRFLLEGTRGFLVLGCMDRDEAFVIPRDMIAAQVDFLNTSAKRGGGVYWHLHLYEADDGEVSLLLPKIKQQISLSKYRLRI
jgi:hypothetical protein